ncbi:SdpI family protein [bacterium]|nr:SdpI family protein [bacterium]
MRWTLKTEWLSLLLVGASVALAAYYWPQLPDQIPTHWGPTGAPDQWASKTTGAFIGPLMGVFFYVLVSALPWLDPRGRHVAQSHGILEVIKNTLCAFALFMTYLTLSASVSPGQHLPIAGLMIGLGLLFVVIGNYLPKVRSNFFIGIRTPWTLSNEEVWYQTHRLGGKLMVVAGILVILSAWLPQPQQLAVLLGAIGFSSLYPILFSYRLYKRLATK